MTDQLSLQAGRVTVFQDVDDTTAFTVEVTKDGTAVDMSGSTWADPDGLMTVDTTDAVNGKLGLSCGVQTGNQDWRLQADGDTTWLQGTLVVGSTRHVGAGSGTVSVAVEDQTVTVSAVVPTHDHSGAYRSDDAPIRVAGRNLEPVGGSANARVGSFEGVALDGASTESAVCSFQPHASWTTFDVVVEFAALTADTADVRLQARTYDVGAGDTINTAGATVGAATATLAGQYLHVESTVASGVTFTAGEVVGVRLERLGGDAADTSTADILLYGIRFVKAS